MRVNKMGQDQPALWLDEQADELIVMYGSDEVRRFQRTQCVPVRYLIDEADYVFDWRIVCVQDASHQQLFAVALDGFIR